jgi:hypothetical protein
VGATRKWGKRGTDIMLSGFSYVVMYECFRESKPSFDPMGRLNMFICTYYDLQRQSGRVSTFHPQQAVPYAPSPSSIKSKYAESGVARSQEWKKLWSWCYIFNVSIQFAVQQRDNLSLQEMYCWGGQWVESKH